MRLRQSLSALGARRSIAARAIAETNDCSLSSSAELTRSAARRRVRRQ
ncbi:MAG TPA: hypothetical protein VM033_04390 [Gemmatimonadaceae bacterium]|nr:hypothetical protein [Gemmatimonadaceae bacterium]